MLNIRKMAKQDLEEVVNLHLKSFPGFFLSSLGNKFLKLFYRNIIISSQSVGLVCVRHSKIEGFVCGAINPSEFFRNLLRKKWLHFSLASLGAVLKKPSIIPRLWRTVHQPASSPQGNEKATLMSIGVDPIMQSKGIGEILVQRFLEELKSQGVQEVNLTTDRSNNEAVNEFYQKLGFTLKKHYTTPEKREMNEYVISLQD